MKTVNIHHAKTHLSRLVQEVLDGEEVVIAKAGTPLVVLSPYEPVPERAPGAWKGLIQIADDFDELPAEIIGPFQGEAE